jgi:hypothetical protein
VKSRLIRFLLCRLEGTPIVLHVTRHVDGHPDGDEEAPPMERRHGAPVQPADDAAVRGCGSSATSTEIASLLGRGSVSGRPSRAARKGVS